MITSGRKSKSDVRSNHENKGENIALEGEGKGGHGKIVKINLVVMESFNGFGDGHTWKKANFNLLAEQIGGKFLTRNSFSKKCGMLGR